MISTCPVNHSAILIRDLVMHDYPDLIPVDRDQGFVSALTGLKNPRTTPEVQIY
jgi:hypothetical protein